MIPAAPADSIAPDPVITLAIRNGSVFIVDKTPGLRVFLHDYDLPDVEVDGYLAEGAGEDADGRPYSVWDLTDPTDTAGWTPIG